MKVLVVGGGGREHCLVWKIAQSPLCDRVFCAPGNGGTVEVAENIDIGGENIDGLLSFVKDEGIDLTVIGPEVPLVNGITDVFKEQGLGIFGPGKNGAMIEGSKAFAKSLMRKMSVKQAEFEEFTNSHKALSYLRIQEFPIVIKASGLAAGKGAIIVNDFTEAEKAINSIMVEKRFGTAGDVVVIEEFLEGEEVSLLVLTDGETVIPFISSQDHKQIFDGDKGPNTGGMGAYAPATIMNNIKANKVIDEIILPVLAGLKKEGIEYKGVLYAGIMMTEDGAKVLEFNCRFGDPETQAILPLLETDLVELLLMTANGELKNARLNWDERTAVCVVLASGGYPGKYEKGKGITGINKLKGKKDIVVFHAGTRKENEKLVTNGGRVLGVTGIGSNLKDAINKTYAAVNQISFEGMYYRKDIGNKG